MVKVFIVLFYFMVCSEGAKILAVFPTPSISHHLFFRHLTQELVRRGHELVVITPEPIPREGTKISVNLKEIDVSEVSYSDYMEFFDTLTDNSLAQVGALYKMNRIVFEKQMKTKQVREVLKNINDFDLLIIEHWIRPNLALTATFTKPVIQIGSLGALCGHYEPFGISEHPYFYPAVYRRRCYNLTFWETCGELFIDYLHRRADFQHEREENEMLKRVFSPDLPALGELYKNVQMLFLNTYTMFDGNRPISQAVVHMGGVHTVKETQELPENIKKILDESRNGVIYFSFGTIVPLSLLSEEQIKTLLKVLSQLPYDVLLKWDGDDLKGKPDNVKVFKYFPQPDVLKHPKVKLFVSHGGLHSTEEAIAAGVPLVAIPIFGDHFYNVEQIVRYGIGIHLDMRTVTQEKLLNAINTVIDNKSYRDNVVRLRSQLSDQRFSPLQRAAWWAERAMVGAAEPLRAPAAMMTISEYFEVELVVTVLLVFIAVISALVFLTRCAIRVVRRLLSL